MPRKNPIPEAPAPILADPPHEVDEAEVFYDSIEPPMTGLVGPLIDTHGTTDDTQWTVKPRTPQQEPEPVPEDDRVVAIIPADVVPPTHSIVVGMGTLAAMSEADFQAKLAIMKSGQERLRIIQRELLKEGEDYGHVKGIERPFLQQPGAEKLANFYGLAVEQIAERIMGTFDQATLTWLSPPLAYHVRSLVHLGDFSGPVVAQGYGEANSWEEKYRYRNAQPTCPNCGRQGLIRRKSPPAMAGKWNCPNWNNLGGCNAVFEPNDSRIESGGKIDNPDPYGLAQTILLMAAKRSLVAGVRRATGTSGLFTQDEDSPSVKDQAGESDTGSTDGKIEAAGDVGIKVEPGAKTTQATKVQHDRLKTLVAEKSLNGAKIASLLERIFGMEVEPTGSAATAAVRGLDAEQMGRLLRTIETGEIDTTGDPVLTPGFPPQQSDEM